MITLKGVDASELQRGGLALDGVYILPLDVETSAEKHLDLMELQNQIERERDVVWLELSENNELQAFRYERARQVDLSRAAFYFITALTGAMLVGYPLYALRSERDYPEYFPHPYVVALMVFGGVLLLSTGSAELSINVGM